MATKKAKPTKKPAKANLGKPSRPDVKVFIREYLKDPNGRRAAIAAGYSAASADSQASRLLKNVKVRAEIDKVEAERLAKVQEETGITLERTLREIAKGAFHDPRKFFDEAGNLKPITELDDETAAALAGFDVTEERERGEGGRSEVVGYTKKVKLGDRKGYLDMLMKHLGGYKKDNEQQSKPAAEAIKAFFEHLHSGAGRAQVVQPADRPARR
jgi:phage terminase small subunit